jgi:hypothetical protein
MVHCGGIRRVANGALWCYNGRQWIKKNEIAKIGDYIDPLQLGVKEAYKRQLIRQNIKDSRLRENGEPSSADEKLVET